MQQVRLRVLKTARHIASTAIAVLCHLMLEDKGEDRTEWSLAVCLESAMKPKRKAVQLAMHCRCGCEVLLAHGMCATCYTLRRQDEEYFGGLREAVLERDGYRCRVCDRPGMGKRSITVHHRVPGESKMHLMISLCPGCHARVHRTKAVLAAMPPLLLMLWREQHPKGHEQTALDFRSRKELPMSVQLF